MDRADTQNENTVKNFWKRTITWCINAPRRLLTTLLGQMRDKLRKSLASAKETVRPVLISTAILLLLSAKTRSLLELDNFFEALISNAWQLISSSTSGFANPTLTVAIFWAICLGVFVIGINLIAVYVNRISGFLVFVTLAQFDAVREGQTILKTINSLVCISLPLSLAIAISHEYLSLFSVAYFALANFYVRSLYDPSTVKKRLQWIVRMGVDTPNN